MQMTLGKFNMYANVIWRGELKTFGWPGGSAGSKIEIYCWWESEVQEQARDGWELHEGETWSSTAKPGIQRWAGSCNSIPWIWLEWKVNTKGKQRGEESTEPRRAPGRVKLPWQLTYGWSLIHRGEQALHACANCFPPPKQRDFNDL